MPKQKSGIIDLRNFYVAKFNQDGTYEKPVHFPWLKEANTTVNQEEALNHADGVVVETVNQVSSVELAIGMAALSIKEQAMLTGANIDEKGVMIDNSDDIAPEVAVGFESPKADGSARFVWLYRGRFSIPEESRQTKNDSIEFQDATINGRFIPREDDLNIRATVDSNDETVDSEVIDDWFKAPYMYTAETGGEGDTP
ncbi:major tail protein [Geomicrobium sp. JCM 19038]|uniref:major tail protein n=1 Tax=Geomicrobium sp. JCM 19038 TaxID=1460635 RepID=UPI00045F45E8|nr:major tail protein [Geomicrobium sp. JCM 19038]GAK09002.1 phage major tail protein phi13 [Geomicrobium sp. JCM 19038]